MALGGEEGLVWEAVGACLWFMLGKSGSRGVVRCKKVGSGRKVAEAIISLLNAEFLT